MALTTGQLVKRMGITIFMCGDVMTGRGIDQVLPHPGDPQIFEDYVLDARRYVQLAERAQGSISKPVPFSYIWGDALDILDEMAPEVRIINLETAITTSDDYWKGKGINYRMHPDNIDCLTAAGIEVCSLANNHILDWGYAGLTESLQTLKKAQIKGAGAGLSLEEAKAPAIVDVEGKGRVIVFSLGSESSGIPEEWAAAPGGKPGVNLLPDLSEATVRDVASQVRRVKRPGDVVVASIHWGGNWGYEIPPEHAAFAHNLIDKAAVDILHGHSSHHVQGVEVHRGKPIIYGCGDFINDYEGIGGYELYRGDLSLMYFVEMSASSGELVGLHMKPTRMRNFKVNRASHLEALWLADTLNREGSRHGTAVTLAADDTLVLHWE